MIKLIKIGTFVHATKLKIPAQTATIEKQRRLLSMQGETNLGVKVIICHVSGHRYIDRQEISDELL